MKNLLKENLFKDISVIIDSGVDFSCFKNKTVMVTGASKLLGYYLVCSMLIFNDLNLTNTNIIAVDSSDDIFKKYGQLTSRRDLDFLVSSDFSNIKASKVDIIIHTDTDFNNCANNVLNLFKFAKNCNTQDIVFSSFMDIYGDIFNGKDLISENDLGYVDLQNIAQSSCQIQRIAENIGTNFAKANGININFVRLSNIFGGIRSRAQDNLMHILVNTAKKRNLTIDKEDSKIQSYCYVTDAVKAILLVLTNSSNNQIYNISSNISVSPKVIAENCVVMYADHNIDVIFKNNYSENNNNSFIVKSNYILSNSKISHLGYKPTVTLQDGIIRSVNIIKESL